MRSILWHLKLIPGTGIGRDYFIAEKQSPVPVNVHMIGIILVNAAKPVIFSVNPAYYGFSSMESNIIVSEAVEDFVDPEAETTTED